MSEVKQAPENFYESVIQLLRKAQEKVVHAVNNTMVITYFEIGRMIVEEEQKGKERAEYGRHLVTTLSQRLSSEFSKGFLLLMSSKCDHFTWHIQKVRHCLTNSN